MDDDTGKVAALTDRDSVSVSGRQLSAPSYRLWFTVDWGPTTYKKRRILRSATARKSGRYRQMYEDAIAAVFSGKLKHVFQNSHIPSSLGKAISNELVTAGMVFPLDTFIIGSSTLTCDVLDDIEHSEWYRLHASDVMAVSFVSARQYQRS